jgi:cytochrome c
VIARAVGSVALAAAVLAAACRDPTLVEREAAAMTGGSPARGTRLIRNYGCGSCHVIPGVPGASATVGPSLQGIASRSYVAGKLTNTPANLMRWIRQPHSIDPKTAMPDLGLTEQDARDVTAYLETLR